MAQSALATQQKFSILDVEKACGVFVVRIKFASQTDALKTHSPGRLLEVGMSKVHSVVVRRTFASQKCEKLSASDVL